MTNDVVTVESVHAPVGRIFTGVEAGELNPVITIDVRAYPPTDPENSDGVVRRIRCACRGRGSASGGGRAS
jgi:hypothetical protein